MIFQEVALSNNNNNIKDNNKSEAVWGEGQQPWRLGPHPDPAPACGGEDGEGGPPTQRPW